MITTTKKQLTVLLQYAKINYSILVENAMVIFKDTVTYAIEYFFVKLQLRGE